MSDIMDLDKTLKIKVIGVGGAGNNAISRMIDDNVRGVTFYMINTETGTLKRSRTSNILQIGVQTTRGLGAGANELVGERAAIENKEDIKQMLAGADLVFITAGMGGGTGTGAAPIVAEIAKEMGMSITQFQEFLNQNPDFDKKIEKSASEYAASHDNLIIDAKLGWYAVPYSFKIYLKVDIDVAAKRAFEDEKRKDTEPFASIEQAKELIKYRYAEENKRWLEEYGVHREDMDNYDIVVDTTNLTPEEVYEKVKEAYLKWLDE